MAIMQTKYDVIAKNDTRYFIDLPPRKKTITTKWINKMKHKPIGSINSYKMRLVAKFYTQEKVEFDETFSPYHMTRVSLHWWL